MIIRSLNCSINIEELSLIPQGYSLTGTLKEKENIARRLNLVSLEKLEAELYLQKKELLSLTGKIIADVTQQCVRTLVPLSQHLQVEVNELFSLAPAESLDEVSYKAEDLTEPLQGNILNLGETVIQLLSLSLDSYPVAPTSKPIEYHEGNTPSPFEILKREE